MSLRIALAAAVSAAALAAPLTAQSRPARPAWPDEGPTTWKPRPTAPAITANDLRTRLYAIADDSMGGRAIGSLGNAKTTDYIAREFARLGLKPAGENGTYFQALPWVEVRYDASTIALESGSRALVARTDFAPVALGLGGRFGAAASLSGVPAVFGGRWSDTTALADPSIFRDAVVVLIADGGAPVPAPRPTPPVQRCDSVPDRFGVPAILKYEAEQAALRAARPPAPVLPPARGLRVLEARPAAILLVMGDSLSDAVRQAAFAPRGMLDPNPGTGAALAVVTRGAAAAFFDAPLDAVAVGTRGRPVSARWSWTRTAPSHPVRNVIAVLPGSDPSRAAEYVLVGAHNDHVGYAASAVDHDSLRAVNTVTRRQGANDPVCRPTPDQQRRIDSLIAAARAVRPVRRDSIFNGADDDGSGTVVLLEVAERFAREKPARSIVFVSHQGEESGLLGSRWFVDHPTVDLAKVVAAINMDMVGKGRVEQVKFGGPNSVQMLGARRLSREYGDIIDSVNAISPRPMAIDRSWDVFENPLNRFCRSDQVHYVRKDIPVVYMSLGYAQDYHQLTDEPQYIDYDHAERLGRFVYDVMRAVADRRERPRIDGPDPRYPRC